MFAATVTARIRCVWDLVLFAFMDPIVDNTTLIFDENMVIPMSTDSDTIEKMMESIIIITSELYRSMKKHEKFNISIKNITNITNKNFANGPWRGFCGVVSSSISLLFESTLFSIWAQNVTNNRKMEYKKRLPKLERTSDMKNPRQHIVWKANTGWGEYVHPSTLDGIKNQIHRKKPVKNIKK